MVVEIFSVLWVFLVFIILVWVFGWCVGVWRVFFRLAVGGG